MFLEALICKLYLSGTRVNQCNQLHCNIIRPLYFCPWVPNVGVLSLIYTNIWVLVLFISKSALFKQKLVMYINRILISCVMHLSGIEWSLWTFASMPAVRILLRARAVINFLMQAASTSSQIFHQLESLFIKTLFCLFSQHLKSTLLFRTCQKQSTSQNKLPSNQQRVLEKTKNNRTFKDFSMQQHLLIYPTYKYCIFI